MSAPAEVEPDHYVEDATLQQIVEEMWHSYFGSAEPPLPVLELPAADGGVLCASVTVSGARPGLVTATVPRATAAALAAVMLQEDGEPAEEEVRDSLGEVANIIAGNVKALVPDAGSLGLPVLGTATPDPGRGAAEVARLDAAWREGWVSFVVWLSDPSTGTGAEDDGEREQER